MRVVRKICFLFLCLPMFAIAANSESPAKPGFNEDTFKGLELRSLGPAFMSGRISDIVLNPVDPRIKYIGVGSGGVFKTENSGTTWEPVFDDQGSYSIGCISLDPNRPDTVWVGTGENVSGRHVGFGDGVYRSLDAGKTWTNMGLKKSEHIGMIRVDPRDSNVIYVAAQGPLWSGGGDRGLFKSSDGGATWNKVLGAGEYTGVSEVHLDPRNPDVVYAVSWQRLRSVAALMDGGPESGIHKSTDGGLTWRKLSEGLPEENMGKIGVAISPLQPDVLYATIELPGRTGGFWRSEDGGESWEKRSDYLSSGTGPHYYQEIFANPHFFDRVYQADVMLHYTTDGGKTFTMMPLGNHHSDHHAVAFDPRDPNYLIVGTDGGVYESFDLGENWRFMANLPLTQFYKVSVDYDKPFYNIYGGTQDNSTQGGPSRTDNLHGISNDDWKIILGADGHQPAADPDNPDIVYAEWQQGNLTRYDRKTGESVYIQPQPGKGETEERFNWDSPILISPHDSSRLYFASQRVWRSDDRGDSWKPVSGDLTRNQDRLLQPMMGRQWSVDSNWDLYAMSVFNSITSLSESPLVEGLLYAGTDDGIIQVSEDGGQNWRKTDKLPGVPENFFVNDIKADLHDVNAVYVVVDNHKAGDYRPFVFKSSDRGKSWKSITGDLPERHLAWRLVQDHVQPGLLFLGTEFGLFFSVEGGNKWVKLSGNVPNIPFRDLAIQRRENDLVGATFGRSFYVLDDYTPLRQLSAKSLAEDTLLFPVKDAPWYVPRLGLGCESDGCKSSQGDAYFLAPNPSFGAVFTYYLPKAILSKKEQRREGEKPLEKAGKDTPFPGWKTVEAEQVEGPPAMLLTVTDSAGKVVRYLEAPTTAGFHRVAWDLRYPDLAPWIAEDQRSPWDNPAGVLASPGSYTVTLNRRIDGKLEASGQSQVFNLVSIREPVLAGSEQGQRVDFSRRVDELSRKVNGAASALGELSTSLDAVKDSLLRSTADHSLYTQAQALQQKAKRLTQSIKGNEQRQMMSGGGQVAIAQRLAVAGIGSRTSAYGPTQTQRESLAIAEEEFAALEPELDALVNQEMPELKRQMNAGGVPWTPGRGVPRL
ncbi:MAG: glycosyl hydrolase [Gammaproteobacteria bacterium]|nr:glycosyl hydrolase [Gammaproteobacteria bacterium]